jgi:hypothetical protein
MGVTRNSFQPLGDEGFSFDGFIIHANITNMNDTTINPAKDSIVINYNSITKDLRITNHHQSQYFKSFKIFDLLGRQIIAMDNININDYSYSLANLNLPLAPYFIQVVLSDKYYIFKIIL